MARLLRFCQRKNFMLLRVYKRPRHDGFLWLHTKRYKRIFYILCRASFGQK